VNLQESTELIEPISSLLTSASRANTAKPIKYWYPLSLATYGLEEILEAIDSMCSFRTSMWEKTATFETEFARYIGCREAVMVNSGSSADLLLAFSLVNPARPSLRPGDEVLVPAVTWPTQVWSVLMAGLQPVLADVDPATLNVDFSKVEELITEKTRALFLVHLMGNPCDMDRAEALCKKYDLLLLEDACEALGSTYRDRQLGAWGWGGSFSFFFSHHMTTMEGGMIVCQDAELADHLRGLRAHGWVRDQRNKALAPEDFGSEIPDPRYTFITWGFNVRPTELQAGFGLRQLERLPAFEATRARYETRFRAFLERWNEWLRMPQVCAEARPSWLGLAVMVARDAPFTRNQLTAFLENNGVETRPVVTGNVARQPVVRHFPQMLRGTLAGADEVHERGFYIGLSPMQEQSAMDRLEETFARFLEQQRA
jgi:CDP-4-dehydro-6-deoxyglucose reductase, E1